MRTLIALAALLAQGPPAQETDAYKISVDVNLVVLQTTVHDRKGGFAPDLRERDFGVFEDGVKQQVTLFRHEDVPVAVGLIVDHSRSMAGKIPETVAAARTFARSSNPGDQMFVVNFNENVRLGLPAAMRFTNRADEIENAISGNPTAGMTALYDATLLGLEHLETGGPDKKVLIAISDGADNASAARLADVLKRAGQSTALIYAIGIFDEQDPDRNPEVLRKLARVTGGEAYFPRRIDEIASICGNIARDIRNQYTLGYLSGAPAKPGAWRTVKVTATSPAGKLSVRARSGYFVAGGVPAH